nr:transcription factor TGA1-like [Tanacetum cinerariifolium]
MQMAPTQTHLSTSRRTETCDPHHNISLWVDTYETHVSPKTIQSSLAPQLDTRLTNNPDYNSQESLESPRDSEKSVSHKLQRRLAQNREAARKSRLKKKAYVQQLELGRLKLAKLEHEIEKTRQQDAYMDLSNRVQGLLLGNINSDGVVNHYDELFRMKADAAKVDAFNLLFGSWKSPVERLFQWLGGFRPSEILYILMPQFEPLTDTQIVNLSKLRHTCRQAEDALTQGIDKLHQTLSQSLAVINTEEGGNYDTYMSATIEGLEALENFLNQADHLRHRTLQQMSRILTMPQAAKGLLA